MAQRVRPSALYEDQFPDSHRGQGTIINQNHVFYRVQWDGIATPETLHMDFLEEADGSFVHPPIRKRRKDLLEMRTKQRRFIRKAYDIIRNDENQRELTNKFARTLGATLRWKDVSIEVLEDASTILGEKVPRP